MTLRIPKSGYRHLSVKHITFFFVVTLLVSCSSNKKVSEQVDNYEVVKPIVTNTSVSTDYVAEIQALQNVELRSRVKGYLDKIYIDEGKFVKQGQILFSISSQEYQEELTKAQAELNSALSDVNTSQLELKNVKILVEQNIVSATELEIAQAKLEAAQARVDEAKANQSSATLNLSYTIIKAPFDGVVNRIPYKIGSLIDEGTLLTSISNDKEMYAYFNVSEKEYLDFQKDKEQMNNKEVSLILADGQEYKYKGIIETVDGEIDKSTGNIAFRAIFNNPNMLLRHGSTGKIVISKSVNNAIMIPQKSTFEVQERTYVYVVDSDNIVKLRSITPQYRLEDMYIVSQGLEPDDQFLYEGLQLVKEGDKIIPHPMNLSALIKKGKTEIM
jgi:RND family efflux transporter MFP subunit